MNTTNQNPNYRGCGKPTAVIGTNGGTMPCGALLTTMNGKQSEPYFCSECLAALEKSFGSTAAEFRMEIEDFASDWNRNVTMVYADWLKYEQACTVSDQSPVMSEFERVQWAKMGWKCGGRCGQCFGSLDGRLVDKGTGQLECEACGYRYAV